jgi:tetratricopeptide (TPR) repeat protein
VCRGEVYAVVLNKAKALASAQRHLQKNNIDRALRDLVAVVKDDPKDLRTRQKVAELLARQGRHPEAMKEFSVVAETYAHGGFYPKAAAIYKQMLRIEPDEMSHHLALGEIYQQLAHLSDAMDHFNIVAAHYEEKGTTKDRVKIYKKLSAILPDSLEYAEKLANICLQDADPQAAFEVWRQLAKRIASRGSSDALLAAYEGMHRFHSDDLELTRKVADLYLDRGQPKKALEKLQEAFKVDSQDTETLNLLADAFVDLGQQDKAVAILRELARIYESVGFEDYKNQVFDRIAELDPEEGSGLRSEGNNVVVSEHRIVAGLGLREPETLDEGAQRAVYEVEIFREYGLSERALSAAEKGIAQFSGCFALHRALVSLALGGEDIDRAKAGLTSMYEIGMDKGDYRLARDSLGRVVELDAEDEAAVEKLQAFEDAMGEYVGEPDPLGEDSELLDVSPEALEADDLDDLDPAALSVVTGEATDFAIPSVTLDDAAFEEIDTNLFEQLRGEFDQEDEAAGPTEAEPAPLDAAEAPSEDSDAAVDADDASDFGDFEFDDEELQRLADEMGADSGAAEDPADEPVPEPAAAKEQEPSDEVGTGSGFDLSDLFDLDDLEDLDEAAPSAFHLGRSYYDSGAYADAVIEFKQAIKGNEEVHRAQELLGMAQRRLHDFKAAVGTFRELLRSDPNDAELVLRVLYELAVTYEAVGKPKPATTLYKKIMAVSPEFRDGDAARRLEQLGG